MVASPDSPVMSGKRRMRLMTSEAKEVGAAVVISSASAELGQRVGGAQNDRLQHLRFLVHIFAPFKIDENPAIENAGGRRCGIRTTTTNRTGCYHRHRQRQILQACSAEPVPPAQASH